MKSRRAALDLFRSPLIIVRCGNSLFVIRCATLFVTRFATWAALSLVLLITSPADGKTQSSYQKGRDQEGRQNYEAAYDDYLLAYEKEPTNTQYRAAVTRTRFLAAASKVHRAQLLRESGKLEEALKLFAEAAAIDPSSPIAVQEVESTRSLMQYGKTQGARQPSHAEAPNPDIMDAQGPVKLAPVSPRPVTLKLSEDAKVVYETVGKLAGLNVLFDPDYTSRKMSIELNGVTLQEALDIVAAESRTFWHPMTPNTIFVAADNPAKRKDLEQSVVKTFYLSNTSTPTELQDIVNTLRTVLDVSRIQQLPSQEAIVIRGTPDQVLLAEKMVDDFDSVPPEVVVDVAIMQVSRDKLHNLGITPPTSASLQLQPNTTTSTTSSTTSTTTTSTTNTINLNTLADLNATDFTATISAASANALMSDSNTKIIQNPQLRSLNGQKASLKIGDRVPTATGSYTSGISGVSVSSLVGTQFQYLDVGVNLDITPRIHADGDITLKIVLDVSSVTSYVTIGSISEPVIGQRKVEHEIRLKDGETNLLGGMLEQEDTKSISGIPGLAQIPILKYLFAEKSTEVKDNEVVFVLVPHIVRQRERGELSRRTLDVGNANSIHLRHVSRVTTGSDVGSADLGEGSSATPSSRPMSETPPTLVFDSPVKPVAKGTTFAVNVLLAGAQDASSVSLQLAYDKAGLEIVNVSNGTFLSQGKEVVALVRRDDLSAGVTEISASRPAGSGGVSGNGLVTTVTFQANKSGSFPLKIMNGAVIQPDRRFASVPDSEVSVSVQ